MDNWQKISDVNDASCLMNSYRYDHVQKYSLSKLTIARTYCNLNRYYKDPKISLSILKKLIKFVGAIEDILSSKPQTIINNIIRSNKEKLEEFNNESRDTGKIILTFHFGAFELIPPVISNFLDEEVFVLVDAISVSRQFRIRFYEDKLNSFIPNHKVRFLFVQNNSSLKKIIKILIEKGTVIIFIDENKSLNEYSKNYFEINFLENHKYYLRRGVKYLTTKTKSNVCSFISTYREPIPD